MDAHPDFAECDLPREAELPGFRLTPLAPEVVEEDFAAVVSSKQDLRGLFGDEWPDGLTLEENAIDLAWHEREFTARRSFAWVVRSPEDEYLGCAYIYPAIGSRGEAEIITWIVSRPDRADLGRRLKSEFEAWLGQNLPGHLALTWRSSPAV